MNRVAVFAHYDKNNIIKDYVIYCLKELRKIAQAVVFVSDCDLPEKELTKISQYTTAAIAKRHGEYDFGSYKRGYVYAKEHGLLENADEFILCNDSCYAPLFPFDEMFETMEAKGLDFWGNTMNSEGFRLADNERIPVFSPHIQSYFIAFSKNTFNSEVFDNFLKSVKHLENKDEVIINYEMGITRLLADNGFKFDVYCPDMTSVLDFERLILEGKSPFLKTSIFRYKNIDLGIIPDFSILKTNTRYNIRLIKDDMCRSVDIKFLMRHFFEIFKLYRRKIVRFSLRERTFYFLGKVYKF